MQAESKDYQIYLNGKLIPVTEEVYKAWYRPIWRTHHFARRHGQCACPRWQLCEGDCGLCEYQKLGDLYSLDLLYDDSSSESEALDPAEIVIDAMGADELLRELDGIDSYGSRIARLLLDGVNDRDAGAFLGLAKSTYSDKKMKLRRAMRKRKESNL